MHQYLIEMLECPVCHQALDWKIKSQLGSRIEEADVACQGCHAHYPVQDGIGIFLTPDLPRQDLWESNGQISKRLKDTPELEQRLLAVPLQQLNPTDQFLRAMALEEQGDYDQAKEAADSALNGLYTGEFRNGQLKQFEALHERLANTDQPVVDLASGRCYLVEELARRHTFPIVATDFSPAILRRNRRWLEHFRLYERVSLLAFDARRTPFKDGAVQRMTTFVGLANIEAPGVLLKELRRVVSGELLAISLFFPDDDRATAAAIRTTGMASILFRDAALAQFDESGWRAEVSNSCRVLAAPTVKSAIFEGKGLDKFPVEETVAEWGLLIGN